MKKITMKDIAAEAGVSITTVSKILNNVDMHISEATKKRVKDIVKKYNYVPNEIAKGLRSQYSNMIGVVTYNIADPYVSKIVIGIEAVCKERGIGVVISNVDSKKGAEIDSLNFLSSKMVDGVIFLRALSNTSEEWVSKLDIPIVVVDREFSTHMKNIGMIDSSSVAAVYMAADLLIKNGCKKIGYIGPSADTRSSNRINGYIEALHDNEIEVRNSLIYQKGDFDSDTGLKGAHDLMSKSDPDGIVCANDLIAAGALLGISKEEKRVPDDIKVIGVDNIAISEYLNPPLTTVDLHGMEVGKECANMLISRIKDEVPLSKKMISCEIVRRESV